MREWDKKIPPSGYTNTIHLEHTNVKAHLHTKAFKQKTPRGGVFLFVLFKSLCVSLRKKLEHVSSTLSTLALG